MPVKKILFLNLTAFSLTGGIEKFSRAFLKALSDLAGEGLLTADACSAFDSKADTKFFQPDNYKGFNGQRFRFALYVLLNVYKYDTVVLSHIHLSSIAWIAKKLFPTKRIILVAHGIEVWGKLSTVQKSLLQKADTILAVSTFTKQKIVDVHGIHPDKICIFSNTIDPYFAYPAVFEKPLYLVERYGIQPNEPVIFTLTRLSHSEKHKGYDLIMKVIPRLKQHFPEVKYILSGKYDTVEKQRLEALKEENQLHQNLLLTGFIEEKEIVDHFLLADVFIMPSRKEGFGIVFIEAMACGLPVIAGNKDGSVDALQQGELGQLVDPGDETAILQALEKCLAGRNDVINGRAKKELQQRVLQAFGFETYKQNLKKVLAFNNGN
ncbi:glycosyltransferase family 4 protein [Segetibacter koreensis]|uniref:glycosyltransferase family 4 protein n=1 Tax=Segetibacter koreensis TaxID=398037 RepID=UPI00036865CC|nr:glycosyltransferase family 4 protein [Segetibacter koreensis]